MKQEGTSRDVGVNLETKYHRCLWAVGWREISELTKSEEIQAVRYHYIKGRSLGQVLRTGHVSSGEHNKQ